MKALRSATGLIVASVALAFAGASCTKQSASEHPTHDHPGESSVAHTNAGGGHATGHTKASGGGHPEVPPAKNYSDAIKRIQAHMTSADAIVKSGKYDDVHNDSEAIRALCGSIGDLASARSSGVPPGRVQEVAAWSKELSSAARDFHRAAHAEEVSEIKAHYEHMSRLVNSLSAYVVK